ncbi:MAG: hypothetical protein V3S61_01340 [Dehalococcoidales bacterium]
MGQTGKAPAKKGGLIASLVIMFLVLAAAAVSLITIILKAVTIAGA